MFGLLVDFGAACFGGLCDGWRGWCFVGIVWHLALFVPLICVAVMLGTLICGVVLVVWNLGLIGGNFGCLRC